MKPKDESFGLGPQQNGYRSEYATMEPYAASIIKVITLRRRGTAPLGFSIRGGWEHGTGVFISEIVPGSIAQKQGLRVGDQIVRINGFSIHRAIHMEVLSLLKTCPGIVLKIKRVGILPVKERDKDPVTWKIVEPQNPLICSNQVTHSRVNGSTSENNIIVKVEICVPGSASLGCSIAKGPAELPGIFMCTVKEGGIADQAGLQVGDQILDMNGTSFHDLKLNEAVGLMKSVKDIRLTVKKGAGISLFLDNASTCQSNGNNKNEDCISTTRSLSDGMSTTLKEHDFSGSCSSKSEGSSFQSSVSSDSEKDYSISEESAFEGVPKNGKWSTQHKKNPSSASTIEDDTWLLEEKRSLEEEKRRLEEEKKRLEEEKRKLELEKSSSSSCSSSSQLTSLEDTSFKDNSFLNELQKVAAKMSTKENKGDEVLRNGVPIKTTRAEVFKGKRCKEDAIKRMQHEMLMEEFRAAHRKMFGQQTVLDTEVNGKEKDTDSFDSKMSFKNKSKPPPPPPKTNENNNNKECQKITVNGQVPGLQTQTLNKFERVVTVQDKPVEKEIVKPPTPTNGFRVTVTDRSRQFENGCNTTAAKSKTGTLVEVTPWTTRL
ncbi:PDZ domain-containing protein 7 [Parasteatoda tepidariorum]|uniref:PDZ domain-containing protein 7 n=1 Tax=Parasteatoda tepidariorum TaxID=114398 RepID=UPI00077FCEF1|nr:PDZ domain-containing protein 7 [Parasteatoda tepidariorum]